MDGMITSRRTVKVSLHLLYTCNVETKVSSTLEKRWH